MPQTTTRADRIQALLAPLVPLACHVRNDSARHHGHAGDDGSGETHFHVTVVSDRFAGLSRVARHRLVMDLLTPEFADGLHALALDVRTSSEK